MFAALSLVLVIAATAAPVPDTIVAEGVPPVPDTLVAAAGAYADARAATLLGWHPSRREMLIATRFADVPQVHRVVSPMGARRQLTFFPDRIGAAVHPPSASRGNWFVFSKDAGGGEFFQLYRTTWRMRGSLF